MVAQTQNYTVTTTAGPNIAGRHVKPGDVVSLTENEARYELLAGTIVPEGTVLTPVPVAAVLLSDGLTLRRNGADRDASVADLLAFIGSGIPGGGNPGGSSDPAAAIVNALIFG